MKIKSVQDLQVEATRRHTERIEKEREEFAKQWGGMKRPPPEMVTVRPGIDPGDILNPGVRGRYRRVLDGQGGFITNTVTVPFTDWIRRRIRDGDLEQLTPEEAEAALAEDAAAAAAEEAANQPPPEEPPPPPEGSEQPVPVPVQPPVEAQATEQPAPAATEQPAPAASFKQRRAAHG